MPIFTKTLVSSLLASIFIVNAPLSADEIYLEPAEYEEVQAVDEESDSEIERSIIVTAKQGKPIRVIVDEDGVVKKFDFDEAELADIKLINEKLSGLTGETLVKVRSTLKAVNKGMLKMKGLDDESQIVVEFDGDSVDTDVDFDFDFDFSRLEKLKELDKLGQLKELKKLEKLEQLGELKELKVLEQLMSKEHANAIRERVRAEHLSEQHERRREAQHRVHERQMIAAEKQMHAAHEQLEKAKHRLKQRMIIVDGEDSNIIYDFDKKSVSSASDGIKKFKLNSDNMVLKGHVDAILKLISHGEFTPDELDKLQQMIDSKR